MDDILESKIQQYMAEHRFELYLFDSMLEYLPNELIGSFDDIMEKKRQINEDQGPPFPRAGLFETNLSFGTGGVRAKMDHGYSRINPTTVNILMASFSRVILKSENRVHKICIAFDGRHNSKLFALLIVEVLLTFRDRTKKPFFKVYLLENPTITPHLAFLTREYTCDYGIMITASHNPPIYNGIKIYDSIGCQITAPLTQLIQNEFNELITACLEPKRYQVAFYQYITQDFSGYIQSMREIYAPIKEKGIFEPMKNKYKRFLKSTFPIPLYDFVYKSDKNTKIMFSSLHGPSSQLIPKINSIFNLQFAVEKSTSLIDPNFQHFENPNPEKIDVFKKLCVMCDSETDFIFCTDPDGDRFAMAVRFRPGNTIDSFYILTADEIAMLLCTHLQKNIKNTKLFYFNTIFCNQSFSNLYFLNDSNFFTINGTGFHKIMKEIREKIKIFSLDFKDLIQPFQNMSESEEDSDSQEILSNSYENNQESSQHENNSENNIFTTNLKENKIIDENLNEKNVGQSEKNTQNTEKPENTSQNAEKAKRCTQNRKNDPEKDSKTENTASSIGTSKNSLHNTQNIENTSQNSEKTEKFINSTENDPEKDSKIENTPSSIGTSKNSLHDTQNIENTAIKPDKPKKFINSTENGMQKDAKTENILSNTNTSKNYLHNTENDTQKIKNIPLGIELTKKCSQNTIKQKNNTKSIDKSETNLQNVNNSKNHIQSINILQNNSQDGHNKDNSKQNANKTENCLQNECVSENSTKTIYKTSKQSEIKKSFENNLHNSNQLKINTKNTMRDDLLSLPVIFAYEDPHGFLVGNGFEKNGISTAILMANFINNSHFYKELEKVQKIAFLSPTYKTNITSENVNICLAMAIEKISDDLVNLEYFQDSNTFEAYLETDYGQKIVIKIRTSGAEPIIKFYGFGNNIEVKLLKTYVDGFVQKYFRERP